jgi:hypothetical protein
LSRSNFILKAGRPRQQKADAISLRNHADSLHFHGDIARTQLFIKMTDFIRKMRHRQLFCKVANRTMVIASKSPNLLLSM